MTAWCRRPLFASLLVLCVLGCSTSGSSGGCGGSATDKTCTIDTMATTCPGEFTLECDNGAVPFSKSQCKEAIKQDTQVIYCCVNQAEPGADGGGGGN